MVIPMGQVRRTGHFPWMSLLIVGVTVFVHFPPDWLCSLLPYENWKRILVYQDDLNFVSMIGRLFAHESDAHIFWNMFIFWSVAPWTDIADMN